MSCASSRDANFTRSELSSISDADAATYTEQVHRDKENTYT